MDVPLKNYSSGMHMRLGFSIAANLDPDILLLDEIFAVGDQDFQKQCMQTMSRFRDEGRTLLFVSHAPAAVRQICRRVCVLDQGRLMFDGNADAGLREYGRIIDGGPRATGVERSVGPAREQIAAGPEKVEPPWTLTFLLGEGLQPHHRVLEITCGTFVESRGLAAYVGPERYQHWEVNAPDADSLRPFDYAIASPLLSRVSLNAVARCVAVAMRAMQPGARLYATWLDDPDPSTVPDAPPFHYPFDLLSNLGRALGAEVTRVVPGDSHPQDESVLLIVSA
jgi:hypothetical protein